jgi:hypothetical protein
MSRINLITAAVLGTISIGANDVLAADRHVPAQYSSIQSAINAAANGDHVVVAPGVYAEAINMSGKAITLRSSGGAEVTTIDASNVNFSYNEGSVIKVADEQYVESTIDGFTVTGGRGTKRGGVRHGGGLYARYSYPTVRNCIFKDNRAGAGGGMAVVGEANVENCFFESNVADYGSGFGGAGLYLAMGYPRVRNCVFRTNWTEGLAMGGGLGAAACRAEITNCLFDRNTALEGGAIRNSNAILTVTNCTMVDNVGLNSSGAYHGLNSSTDTKFQNCIFWNNTSPGGPIYSGAGAQLAISFSNVPGGYSGEGNIDVDPMFNSIESGSFQILPNSPCVDAGNDTALPDDVTTDLAGNERVFGDSVDMGAFEALYSAAAECVADIRPDGGDGTVTVTDVVAVVFAYGNACGNCSEDISPELGDGEVNINDVMEAVTRMGPCPN